MKRLGRLFFDLLALAGSIIAIAFGVVAITGTIPNWTHISSDNNVIQAGWDARDVLREVHPEAFWMGVVALAMGSIAAITSLIGIIMVFRAKSHLKLTIFSWVFFWIAVGLASYAMHRFLNIDPKDVYTAAGK